MSVRRRGNGLTADSYVLLLDVDPRLSDALLAALATAGVAAYTTPAPQRPAVPAPARPSARPLEAVHVDSTRRPDARRVLEETMPDLTTGLPSIAEEDIFAALVAGFDTEPTTHDWPSSEDLDVSPPPVPPAEGSGRPQRRRTDGPTGERSPTSPDAAGPRPGAADSTDSTGTAPAGAGPGERSGDDAPPKPSLQKPTRTPAGNASGGQDVTNLEPDDEGYVPPPIEPMPPAHPVTKWGLVALGLGVVLLIFPTLLGLRHTTAVDAAAVLSILGGVGLLVSRLSSGSPDDDGPDDGAVV